MLDVIMTEAVYALGDGTAVFPIPMPFLDARHIQALRRGGAGREVLAPGVDYEVARRADGSGELTLLAAGAAGEELAIRRVVPLTQEHDLHNQGAASPELVERSLDKLTMIAQQLHGENAVFADAIAENREGLAALENAKADRTALAEEAATRAAADAALAEAKADADDPRLSDARTPLPHADSHAEGGSDPVAPADIGALGREHVAPALVPDPHPQYATHGYVDLATGGKSFFIFGNGGVRVRGDIGDDALNGMFELAAGGVRLKGSV